MGRKVIWRPVMRFGSGRALNYRHEVRTWRAGGGIVLIGRGVVGRLETAVEVDDDRRS